MSDVEIKKEEPKKIEEAAAEEVEKLKKVCVLPPILTFKGIRRVVLENVWKKADIMEKEGKPLTSEDFSRMLKEEWKLIKERIPKAKQEYEVCLEVGNIEKVVDGLIEEDKAELKELGVKD